MVFQGLVDQWDRLVTSGDVRSNKLPFIRDPTVVICAAIAYLVMVIVGPRIMEKRKPLEIRKVLILYNFCSVLFSVWMMWEFIACSFLNPKFDLLCQDLNEGDTDPTTIRLVHAHWWYFFSKFIEFLDTFFFVVRKKNNQISFLHVYHHASMLFLQWCLVKYVPGAVSYFGPLLNCFIHSVMYAYYMLSAFGPHMQKYLWWKKYLTRMQMMQFCAIFLYLSNVLRKGCKYWDNFNILHLGYMTSLLYLFGAFYNKSFSKKTQVEKKVE
jgi:elongation of very long chain fatty acids protein 4